MFPLKKRYNDILFTSPDNGRTLKHRWQRFTQKLPIYTLAVMRWAKDYNNDSGCGSDDDDHVDDHNDVDGGGGDVMFWTWRYFVKKKRLSALDNIAFSRCSSLALAQGRF